MSLLAGYMTAGAAVSPADRVSASEVAHRLVHRGRAACVDVTGPCGGGLLLAPGTAIAAVGEGPYRTTIAFAGTLTDPAALRRVVGDAGVPGPERGDAALVLAAWRALGRSVLPRLRGKFAFALHDPATGELICARDRFGREPLYYAHCRDGFAFASEIQALLAWPDPPRNIDFDVIGNILSFGHAMPDRAALGGIYPLRPGHVLVRQPDGAVGVTRWSPNLASEIGSGGEPAAALSDARAGFEHLLDRSLRQSGASSPAVLGGGAAQRAIQSSLERLGVQGTQEPAREMSADDLLAGVTRLQWHQGQPIVAAKSAALLRQMHVTPAPALAAAGGAELLLSHPHYAAFVAKLRKFEQEGPHAMASSGGFRSTVPFMRDLYHDAVGLLPEAERMALCGPGLIHTVLLSAPDMLGCSLERATVADAADRASRLDIEFRLAAADLALLDATAAAAQVRIDTPFLDEDLVDYCLQLPVTTRRALLPISAEPRLPSLHANSSALGDAAGRVLLDRQCLERGVFARTKLERLIRSFGAGERRHAPLLWAMLGIELWLIDFADRVAPRPNVSAAVELEMAAP